MIVSLRLCARGEEYINGQCSYCKKRYYSLLSFTNETKTNEITCLICENNADCLGYDSLIPKYGYWRFNENSSLMVKCKLEKSCPIQTHMLNLGLEESNYSNFIYEYKCTKGYKGNLCSDCDEGYGKNSDAECVVCSNSPWLFVRFFFFSLALMLFMIFQAKSALSFKESDSKKRSLLKIIVDHMSFITFIYRFNIEWEPSISSYFTTTDKFITTSPKEVFNFNCFLILFFHTKTNTYHINSAIVSFSPLLFGIITLFLQYLIEIVYVFAKKRLTIFKNKRKNLARKSSKLSFDEIEVEKIESLFSYRKLKKRVIALLIVLYYNFYPRLILNGFQLFKCIELNNENEVYLEEDPDLICWQDRHLILVAGIGVPNLIIWGILMPIIISFIAFKMKILMILTMRYDYWKDLLNYVTIDYHPDKYYWETFLYLQKFFVVGVSISTSRLDPVSQGGLMIMLFLCFFLIYEFYGPSKYIIVNKYRVYSYMTIISTAAFAILISNESLEPAIKLFYLCCLLVVNIFFYVGWGYNFVKVQIDANKVILDKISGLAKKITSRKTIKSQINP